MEAAAAREEQSWGVNTILIGPSAQGLQVVVKRGVRRAAGIA